MELSNPKIGNEHRKPLSDRELAAQKTGHLIQLAQKTPEESDLFHRGLKAALESGMITEDEAAAFNDVNSDLRKFAPWMPHEANPFLLQWARGLNELGSPEGSIDAETIELGQSWKTRRDHPSDEAFWHDYEKQGWPTSEGPSRRWVTPEEHAEILRRLKTSGLTMAGSEVVNVSWTLSQIMETDFPATPWVVDGLLRRGGAAMVYGMAGVGKTWLTLTLMLLAAHGKGFSTADGLLKAGDGEGTKVLLVDGEMIMQDLQARTGALVEGMQDFDKGALDRITVYPKAAQDHRAKFFDLADRAWLSTLIEYVKTEGFGVVVFDNLSTLSPTLEDENAATAWSPLNDAIVALKREGVASLLVHHAGKHETYRGSSNIVATLETVIALKQVGGSLAKVADAQFQVEIEKSRNYGKSPLDFKILRLHSTESFGVSWSAVVDEFSLTQAFCDAVRSLRYTSQQELGEALGGASQPTVSRVLATAKAQGKISSEEYKECLKKARELQTDDSISEAVEELDI